MYKLTINTANEPFDGEGYGRELARILREQADKVEGYHKGANIKLHVHDVNGNDVGMVEHVWSWTSDEEDVPTCNVDESTFDAYPPRSWDDF